MKNDTVINLTDCNLSTITSRFQEKVIIPENNHIAVGSYLCGNYFRMFCSSVTPNDLPSEYDLVIPLLAQHDLSLLKNSKTLNLIKNSRFLIVNDPGMLMHFGNSKQIRLGRLFNRAYRDHRYPAYEVVSNVKHRSAAIISSLEMIGCKFSAVEYEMSNVIDNTLDEMINKSKISFYYHTPYRLVSAIRICEYASEGRPIEQKFLPDDRCKFQCLQSHILYSDLKFNNGYLKIGKGLYDYAPKFTSKEKNLIIAPKFIKEIER